MIFKYNTFIEVKRMDDKKKGYIGIRIDEDLKTEFQELLKSKAVNMSELFRQWITNYIKQNK